jgi:hypothetical protein
MLVQAQVVGPQVNLPGSQQLAPAFFAFLAAGLAVGLAISLLVRRARNRDGHRSFPAVSTVLAVAVVGAIVMAVVSWPPPFRSPEFPPTGPLFPPEAFFYRTAADLPVAADSERWLASMGEDTLAAGFGGEPVGGVVFGVPFNPVDADTPTTRVEMRGDPSRSYTGPYPIADPAYIESMPTYGFDNHYVALDQDARSMWELIGTTVWFGRWQADAGARWDLDSLAFGGPATTASRLPLLPGTLTYDEVVAGEVRHVVWAGAPSVSSSRFVWPALATDGLSDSPDAPPMGAWLRLRADADLDGLGPQARVIAEGLQDHGMILSDTSTQNFGLRGTPDGRWDRADLRTLERFTPGDFEVVDPSAVVVAPDSMAAVPPGGG